MGWNAPLTVAVCLLFFFKFGDCQHGPCVSVVWDVLQTMCISPALQKLIRSWLSWIQSEILLMWCQTFLPTSRDHPFSFLFPTGQFAIGKAIDCDLKLHESCPSGLSGNVILVITDCTQNPFSRRLWGWGIREKRLHAWGEPWPIQHAIHYFISPPFKRYVLGE